MADPSDPTDYRNLDEWSAGKAIGNSPLRAPTRLEMASRLQRLQSHVDNMQLHTIEPDQWEGTGLPPDLAVAMTDLRGRVAAVKTQVAAFLVEEARRLDLSHALRCPFHEICEYAIECNQACLGTAEEP